ncbi:hypothetical protein ACP4OV_028548 [Aristida adscensionis]
MEKASARVAAAAAAVVLALLAGGAVAQQASGVTAVKNSYTAALAFWDLWAVRAYCATWDSGMPLEWLQRYGWAAFCGPAGPQDEASCGRCLLVTNEATGAQATVRILGQCSFGGARAGPLRVQSARQRRPSRRHRAAHRQLPCQD